MSCFRRRFALAVLAALASLELGANAAFHSQPMPDFDPYVVLGVDRRANSDRIKAAYRSRAMETHPDKNPDLDPAESAEAFRAVAAAFEILSDDAAKRKYDLRYEREWKRKRDAASRRAQQEKDKKRREEQRRRQQEEEEERTRARLRNSPAVKVAQSRVLKVSSLEQLTTIVVDGRTGRVERDLYLTFVGNKKAEQFADETLLFPYPFAGGGKNANAGGSGNGVLWDDLIQTAKVRYNKPSDLTAFFRAPTTDEMKALGNKPYVVYVRKGDALRDFRVYSDKGAWNKRDHLERWVNTQLATAATFVNRHRHKIEIYSVDGARSVLAATVPPGGAYTPRSALLGQEFVARDWRVDKYPGGRQDRTLTDRSTLGRFTIKDRDARIDVETKECVDMSGHCEEWAHSCDIMTEFMSSVCGSTCGLCTGGVGVSRLRRFFWKNLPALSPRDWWAALMQSALPSSLGGDMDHLLAFRKNTLCTVALLGFGLGFAAILWAESLGGRPSRVPRSLQSIAVILFVLLPALCIIASLAVTVPPRHVVRGNPVLDFLCVYAVDMKHVVLFRKNAAAAVLLFCLAVGLLAGSVLASATRTGKEAPEHAAANCADMEASSKRRREGMFKTMVAAALLSGLSCLTAVLLHAFGEVPAIGFSAAFLSDMDHVLAFRKNAAATVAVCGFCLGLRSVLWNLRHRSFPLFILGTLLDVASVCCPLLFFLMTHFLGEHSRGGYDGGLERFLRTYRGDLIHVAADRKNAAAAVFSAAVLVGLLLGACLVLQERLERQQIDTKRQKLKLA